MKVTSSHDALELVMHAGARAHPAVPGQPAVGVPHTGSARRASFERQHGESSAIALPQQHVAEAAQ